MNRLSTKMLIGGLLVNALVSIGCFIIFKDQTNSVLLAIGLVCNWLLCSGALFAGCLQVRKTEDEAMATELISGENSEPLELIS